MEDVHWVVTLYKHKLWLKFFCLSTIISTIFRPGSTLMMLIHRKACSLIVGQHDIYLCGTSPEPNAKMQKEMRTSFCFFFIPRVTCRHLHCDLHTDRVDHVHIFLFFFSSRSNTKMILFLFVFTITGRWTKGILLRHQTVIALSA